MIKIRTTVERLFAEALAESGAAPGPPPPDDLILLQSGLDSLGFAILVTRLETELGYDPFILMPEPFYPRTFGELVEIYERFKSHAK